ncbi:MAG: prepilin-type N-terminal cleavage/methylation domain-containing protein [Deltaproteobacteria bacterium]|nr:prepilin-type N-terminal cleavage/methylation domain-containing protein [Deltaproteobacteria bacterium]
MNPNCKVIKKGLQTDGFTLFELMVAMVILAVGLFAIVQLGVVSVRGNGFSRERIEAMEIASGVLDEIKTRSSRWVDNQTGPDPTFAQIFPDITLCVEPPDVLDPGQPLDIDDLEAWPTYLSGAGVRKDIADGTTPVEALKINADGEVAGCGDLTCARAIYRVHYIAYGQSLMPPLDITDLARITIFVSWDSKDYGEKDYNWENEGWWNAGVDFWKRHMVVATTEIFRGRNW